MSNIPLRASFIGLMALTMTGCPGNKPDTTASAGPPIQQTIAVIGVQEADKKIKADPHMVILDVRTPDEFAMGHLAKAQNIDFMGAEFRNKMVDFDRNKKYLVYCQVGGRSAQAVELMKNDGFKEVYDMGGGITDWMTKSLPVVR